VTGQIKRCSKEGIELIAPHRSSRNHLTQDGCLLHRYWHAWRVKQLFAWLYNSHRLVVRWERCPENFLGCILILLRRYETASMP
jgi:hypothetical protein